MKIHRPRVPVPTTLAAIPKKADGQRNKANQLPTIHEQAPVPNTEAKKNCTTLGDPLLQERHAYLRNPTLRELLSRERATELSERAPGLSGHSETAAAYQVPTLREQQIRHSAMHTVDSTASTSSTSDANADSVAYLRDPMLKAATKSAHNGTVNSDKILTKGNTMESIDLGGDNIFSSQADMIRRAKEEILLQTFMWEPNSIGADKLLKGLHKLSNDNPKRTPEGKVLGKDNKPIKVCLLLNEPGGIAFKIMCPGGQRINLQDPEVLLGLTENTKNSDSHQALLKLFDIEVRTHRQELMNVAHSKTLVVDGQYAALTGANVQERNRPAIDPTDTIKFFDIGVTMEGSVAQGLREDFVNNWNRSINQFHVTHNLEQKEYKAASENPSGSDLMILTKKSSLNPLKNSISNPQDQAILAAVNHAKERIQILASNFNTPELEKALLKAMDRGVKVDILVTATLNEGRLDNIFGGRSNISAFRHLFQNAKSPENCDLRCFKSLDDLPAFKFKSKEDKEDMYELNPVINHAKLMIIDSNVAITGSGNMDKVSWYHASETNIASFDPKFSADIQSKVFNPLWEASEKAPASFIVQ